MGFLTRILLILLIFFSPINVFASTEKQVELPARDSALIINTLNRQLVNNWMDLIIYSNNNAEEEAVLAMLRIGAKVNSFNYIINQLPKEVLNGISKSALIVSRVYFDPTMSNIMKIGLEEVRINILNWLLEKEVKVSSGNIEIKTYRAYKGGSANASFSYTIVYSPREEEIIIEVFSPNRVATPRATRANPWSGGIDYLEPFEAKISGKMKHDRGSYVWISQPKVDVSFTSSVPDIQLEVVSSLDAQFIAINNAISAINDIGQSIGSKIKNAIDSVLGFVFDIFSRFSEAAIFSFLDKPDDATVIDLQDEVKVFKEEIKEEIESSGLDEKDEEIERLNKVIDQLEKELANSLKEESVVIANSVIERVNINTASLEDLTKIVHIGPARAQEIINLRPFTSLDDLTRVPGIGVKIIEDIKAEGIAYVDEVIVEKEIVVVDKYNPCDNGGVDINTATKEYLLYITSIGEKRADDIISLRPFTSLDDLVRVSGIGSATLAKIKEQGCAYVIVEKKEDVVVDKYNPCDSGGVDINNASKEDLVFITGIGEAIAERIINARHFSSIDDLVRVNGIGSATLAKIKEQGCAYVSSSSSSSGSSGSSDSSSSVVVSNPVLSVDKSQLTFNYDLGGVAPQNQSFNIANTGSAVLNWSIDVGDSWVVVDSTSGSIDAGSNFDVSVGILVDSLGVGSYSSTMTVIGASSSHDVLVNLNVLPEPQLADRVIITQVKVNEEEFIELYNPTLEKVSFNGWYLSYFSPTKNWGDPYRNWAFLPDLVIEPDSYFLINVYNTENADWELTTATEELYSSGQLGNSAGSVGIFSCNPKESSDCEVDVVGWGEVEYVFEGSPALVPEKDSSLQRRKDSLGNYIDNNDNLTDFVVTDPFPKNSQTVFDPALPIEDLTIVNSGDDYVSLSWTEPESYFPLTYEVRYLMNNAITEDNWDDATLASSTEIKLLNFNTNYYFAVKSFNGRKYSLVSNNVEYTTPSFPMSLSWSTFQGSSKRSGRTDNPVLLSQNPEIVPFIERDRMSFYGPVVTDQKGVIYFTGRGSLGEGLFSYNTNGDLNWYLDFYKSYYVNVLSDGSVLVAYHEVDYIKTHIVNVNRDGTIKWQASVEESYYPIEHCVVLANGNIVVPILGKIMVFDGLNGNFLWDLKFTSSFNGTRKMSVSAYGNIIYVNYNENLYRVEDESIVWQRSFKNNYDEFIPISSVAIGDGGELYFIGYDESMAEGGNVIRYSLLHSADPLTGKDVWISEPIHGLNSMPFVNYNGDVLAIARNQHNGFGSLYKYSSDGVLYDGFPKYDLPGLTRPFIVDGDNNIYGIVSIVMNGNAVLAFDELGNNIWSMSDLGIRDDTLSISSDGVIYCAGEDVIYAIR